MKKVLFLALAAASLSFTTTSCESKKEENMENAAEGVREGGEMQADATEEKADMMRDSADAKADAMENAADAMPATAPATETAPATK